MDLLVIIYCIEYDKKKKHESNSIFEILAKKVSKCS